VCVPSLRSQSGFGSLAPSGDLVSESTRGVSRIADGRTSGHLGLGPHRSGPVMHPLSQRRVTAGPRQRVPSCAHETRFDACVGTACVVEPRGTRRLGPTGGPASGTDIFVSTPTIPPLRARGDGRWPDSSVSGFAGATTYFAYLVPAAPCGSVGWLEGLFVISSDPTDHRAPRPEAGSGGPMGSIGTAHPHQSARTIPNLYERGCRRNGLSAVPVGLGAERLV
jgi:hypothetical protein